MEKLHIHSVLCEGCCNHTWLWYCKNGHDVSVFGEMTCQDFALRGEVSASEALGTAVESMREIS